jgi:PHD/YefM family antitoxin component YafN of YafNO toxin-antitoxin module
MRVSQSEFLTNTSDLVERALKEPVTIASGGRDRLVMLSAAEYERLILRDRTVVALEDFTEAEMADIAKARVPAEYDYLNAELDD